MKDLLQFFRKCALSFLLFIGIASSAEIDYTLEPSLSRETPYLLVHATFKGNETGETIIAFPHNWANGEQGKSLQNITIKTNNGKLLNLIETKNPAEKKVVHQDNAKLNLTYEIHPNPDHPYDVHRAIIHRGLIHAPGYALFAVPHLNEKQSYKIKWDLPEKWKTLSSHGLEKESALVGDTSTYKLQHSLYIVGLSRIYKFNVKDYPVYVSLEGTFKAKDEELLDDLKIIVSSQRDFFSDYNFPFYFFSLISSQDPRKSGGTGLENCFTAYFPKEHDPKYYLTLISHEHLHAWTGGKIGKDTLENLAYWWSEGFTDYYARLLLYRSGLLSIEDFISEINSFLVSYHTSPVKNAPNSRIDKDYWTNSDVEKLPYYRGFVFALWLDSLIKINTNQNYSLDTVMKGLFIETQKINAEFTPELFNHLVKNIQGKGIEKDLKNYIDEGKTIDLSHVSSIIPLKEQEIYDFYLGFSLDDLVQKKEIKNLDCESNAYKAGLRENDVIEKLDLIMVGDPDQVISMTVKGKTIQFKPCGNLAYKIPQISLTTGDEKKSLEKWFFLK